MQAVGSIKPPHVSALYPAACVAWQVAWPLWALGLPSAPCAFSRFPPARRVRCGVEPGLDCQQSTDATRPKLTVRAW